MQCLIKNKLSSSLAALIINLFQCVIKIRYFLCTKFYIIFFFALKNFAILSISYMDIKLPSMNSSENISTNMVAELTAWNSKRKLVSNTYLKLKKKRKESKKL